MRAPIAEEIPHALEIHGHHREDPFFWMRDRESPKVLAHLAEENTYTEAMLAPVKPLREKVLGELKARIQQHDESYPFFLHGYDYYRRLEAGKEYPIYARRSRAEPESEEILLNVNELAAGREYTQVPFPEVSPDSTKIIYAADFAGRRFFDLYVKDLSTGELIGEPIARTTGNVEWANDSRTFFYAKQHPETLRSQWIYRHELTADSGELIYEESDDTFDVGVAKSRDEAFLFFVSSSTLSSEWRVLDAERPKSAPWVFLPREEKHEYSLESGGDAFYVVSNWQAQNFRMLKAPLSPGGKERWEEVIPNRPEVLLEGVSFFKTHYVLSEREGGQTRLRVVSRATGVKADIAFPDPVFVAGVDTNPTYDSDFLRFRYESLNRPTSQFDYFFATDAQVLRKQQPVPTYDSSQYISERLWVVARDGTRVPVSLVYRKGFQRNGRAPLFQYGYGSYGMSMEPWFQSDIVSLLDRGFLYAIAHIRGGSEMGRAWYDNGKLMHKLNTFTDFIDVTEQLVREQFCDPKRVYASGASAGGLLMGAISNLRPDLYRGLIAGVPFVDVLTTMLDETIPLTTSEYDEWGDPRESEAYRFMATYSPYDNVKPQEYPAMLLTAGLHDSQVQYWEPAKWAAKLRKLKTDLNPILLFTEMDSGHGGASGRFQALEQTALEFAFILMLDDRKD